MRIILIVLAILVALAGSGCEGRNVADSTITTNVKSKMAVEPETSAFSINVETNGGVVTLTGAVPTQAEKTHAEQIARNTEGVTRVINNIVVDPNSIGGTNAGEKAGGSVKSIEEGAKDAGIAAEDLTILSKIKARYISEGIIGANIDVKNGIVVLKGEVENSLVKARAESIARATSGVKSVKNMIVVKQ
ncbi:MAG: BON domain-containing protein [Blastocatellia bacterium]